MNAKKKIAVLVTAAAMASSASCSDDTVVKPKHQDIEVTLSWWGNDTRNEYTLQSMDKFEELNPEISVSCSYSEWSGYEARSHVRMISDTEADVMQINVGWLTKYSPDGHGYYDLEKLTNVLDLSNFSQEFLNYGRVNGILNGIPIAMNAETVYINQTLYENYGLGVPKTWDDLFSAAKVMKKDGIYPISTSQKSLWLLAISYSEQMSGKEFLNSDGTLGFTVKEIQTMIDFYCRMVEEKVLPQVEDYDKLNVSNGKYAGTVAWVSDAENYCGGAIENGYTMIPADYLTNGKVQPGDGWYAKPASLYTISKNTEHPEEAGMLLNYMLNSREMAVLQGVEKGIPLSTSARGYLEEEDMLNGVQYDASLVMENNTRIRHMDPFLENSDVIEEYVAQSNLVIFGRSSSEEAAAELLTAINDALK